MEVSPMLQDGLPLGFVERGELLLVEHPPRLKRRMLQKSSEVDRIMDIFFSGFSTTFSFTEDSGNADLAQRPQAAGMLEPRGQDISSAESPAVGRDQSCEDRVGSVASQGTASVSGDSTDLNSSLLGHSLELDTATAVQVTQDTQLSVPLQHQSGDDKTLEADDKPLIGSEAPEDGNEAVQADLENPDPSKMPLSNLFKTTKAKKSKSKKAKGKDVTDPNVTDDVTNPEAAQAEQDHANSTDTKTDVTAEGEDTPAVVYTTESRDVTLTLGEGPQLTQSEGVAVEAQPTKADGALPPESEGREKESLLHDPNPEGMVCCAIL